MAKSTLSLPVLFLFLLLLSFNTGGTLKLVHGQEKSWCVAKPSASDMELQANMDYACNQVKDCKLIQEGGSCFHPNTLQNHASVAMNMYYQTFLRNLWNCNFRNSGLITQTDPSYGSCKYA